MSEIQSAPVTLASRMSREKGRQSNRASKCGNKKRRALKDSELRDQVSAMLGELDYFRRYAVRFWKFVEKILDTLSYAGNHIFCHLRIDR